MERSKFSGDSANLDLIRAVAVLCVFGDHLKQFYLGRGSDWTWRFGHLGVLIFFVHTSLVLMLSMDRSRLTGAPFFTSFFLRRAFRIYPLAILFVLGVYAFGDGHWRLGQLAANLTLTSNLTYTPDMWTVMWSLPVEVQMYLMLPAIFLFCRGRALRWAMAIWVASIPVSFIQPHVSVRLSVLTFAPCFLGGVIAWRVSRESKRTLPAWLWPFAFAATTLVWLSCMRADAQYHRCLFGLALGMAIPYFREISWTPLVVTARLIARYSYGIYLSHPAAIAIALALPIATTYRWIALFVIAVIAPIALYHLLEKPMIGVGQSLTRRLFETKRRNIRVSSPA